MNKSKYSNLLPILTFLIGGLLGTGAIWSWKSAQIDEARLLIEEARASLELREKMSQLFLDIAIYQSDKVKRNANYKKYKLKIENYNSIERSLAKIEKRNAKEIDFEALITTTPPTNLKAHVIPELRKEKRTNILELKKQLSGEADAD